MISDIIALCAMPDPDVSVRYHTNGRMLPIWGVVIVEFCFAYYLECLVGSPMSFKMACTMFDPKNNHPMIFETAIISCTVLTRLFQSILGLSREK